jgi:hypothetical protein
MSTSDYRPTVTEIATRLSARTLTPEGDRIGDFTDETFPTAAQVDELIDDAVAVVSSSLGEELEDRYWTMAKTAVIAYTCMEVEAGFYPETTAQADSAYAAFRQRFQDQVASVEKALNEKRPNERRIVSLRQYSVVNSGVGGRLDPWANELLP